MKIVLVTPGVFTDAGGIIIYVGSDGKLHVKRVPPWGDPLMRAELQVAVQMLDATVAMKDSKVAAKFTEFATGVLNAHIAEITKQMSV